MRKIKVPKMPKNSDNLPIVDTLLDAWDYMSNNKKAMGLFSFVNLVFIALGFGIGGGFSSPFFIAWVVFYYCFWVFFFRFYFQIKPYMAFRRVMLSLIPSTRILFLVFVFIVGLRLLPFAPLLFPMNMEFGEKYAKFLETYMEGSKVVDLISIFVLIMASPIIFFRPFMAWISSIVGISKSIRRAWIKTTDNYWRMFWLFIVVNAPFVLLNVMEFYVDIYDVVTWVLISPIIVYCNVVMAKSYEFFFGCKIGECVVFDVPAQEEPKPKRSRKELQKSA